MLVDHNAIGDTTALGEHHRIAGAKVAHLRPDAAYDSAGLDADFASQGRALVGQCRQQSQRDHYVAEVECRGRHLDFHVVRPQPREWVGLHFQTGNLARALQGKALSGIFPRGHQRISLSNTDQSRRPQAIPPHGQFPLAQVAPCETGQSLEVLGTAQVHQPKIDPDFLADFESHAPSRSPQGTPPRLLHLECGPMRHHGQAAGLMSVLEPVGNQSPDKGNELHRYPFPCRIVGVGPAEEVDRLQVGHLRPLFQCLVIAIAKNLRRNQAHPGRIQQGHPLGCPAMGLAQHPPGAGETYFVGGNRPGQPRLQQGRAPSRTHHHPAFARLDEVALVVTDQGQTTGNRHSQ